MAFRCAATLFRSANHNVVLFRAESWNATYVWVPSNGVNGTVGIGNGQVSTEAPQRQAGILMPYFVLLVALFHGGPG